MDINLKSTSDGWRGKLADTFTFVNVEVITHALIKYLIDNKRRKIVISYDTRFMGSEFASYIANIMCKFGIDAFIVDKPMPTPILTYTVKKYDFLFGINVTASHNPPFDNGIKIRMNYGGPPTEKIIKDIETNFHTLPLGLNRKGSVQIINPFDDYYSEIKLMVDFDSLKNLQANILVDTMHGATSNILGAIFKGTKINIDYLNQNEDPYFGGINPEPKYESTQSLQNLIKKGYYDFGIAHDGDGDRIIAVDPFHGYLSPHDISAILVLYLAKYKKIKNKVLGSSTLGRKTKRICDFLNLEYQEIPVGFKNATNIMLSEKILLAAEENGGLGFGFYLPERDATLVALKLIEAQLTITGGIRKLLSEVNDIAGESGFCRYNYFPNIDRQTLYLKILNLNGEGFDYSKIDNITKLDGLKINYTNGSWISMRFSGTESVIRIYCESDTREEALQIKDFIVKKIENLDK
jgi:phosphomannomutase